MDWNEEEAINNLLNVQLVEGVEEQKQEQPKPQQAQQQQDPRIAGYRRTCLKGHHLVHHPAEKAKRRTNRAGQIYVSNSDRMVCNGCRKMFKLAPRGSYSCVEACDFDLCMDCSTCDKGHMLVNYKGLPEHFNPAYKYGVLCSRCKKRLDHGEINNFCRCNTCGEYDVCRTCCPKPTG